MTMKSQRREIMNVQILKGFAQPQNMMSLSGISQKIWLSTHMIISTNLSHLLESILVENLVPLIVYLPRKIDKFVRDMIFEKRAGSLEVAADSNLVRVQQKLLDVMGPLSEVSTTVEKASNSGFEQVDVSLLQILTNLDETVILLGQAFNNILNARRFNALKQINRDPRKTKQLLKVKRIFVKKKHNFYLTKCLSLISLELPKANKNQRNFSRQ